MIKNATYNQHGTIDCEVNHQTMGWTPFTATPDDPTLLGQLVYAQALTMKPAPYVPPSKAETLAREREGMQCSAAQMGLALIDTGKLDDFEAAIAENQPAAMIWSKAALISRRGPMLDVLKTFLTDAKVDALFRAAMATHV